MWLFPPKPPHHRIERFFQKELNLSDDQKDQFNALREKHIATVNGLHEALQKNKSQLFEALSENPMDSVLVDEIIQKESEIHAKLEKALLQHFLDLKSICSEEQQRKLGELFGKMIRPGPPPRKR